MGRSIGIPGGGHDRRYRRSKSHFAASRCQPSYSGCDPHRDRSAIAGDTRYFRPNHGRQRPCSRHRGCDALRLSSVTGVSTVILPAGTFEKAPQRITTRQRLDGNPTSILHCRDPDGLFCVEVPPQMAAAGGEPTILAFVLDSACAPIAVIGQTLVNRLLTTLPGHEQLVQVIPEAEVHGGPSPAAWRPNRPSGRQVLRHRCRLPLPAAFSVFLKEDKGPDDDVLAASCIGGRGRVDAGSMERPARNGAVGHRVIAFEH